VRDKEWDRERETRITREKREKEKEKERDRARHLVPIEKEDLTVIFPGITWL
jgi:hypothetical protein